MVGHGFETFWTIDFQRYATAHGPGREDQVRIADRVVRVKVGDKGDPQFYRFQSFDTFIQKSGAGPSYDARPEVHKVGGLIYNDRSCRSRAIGCWPRSAGPQ